MTEAELDAAYERHEMSDQNAEYALFNEVVALRVYPEPNPDEEAPDWMLDGVDAEGKYTESCWSFNTEQEAVEAIPEFCVNHEICDGPAALALPVIDPYATQNDRSEADRG